MPSDKRGPLGKVADRIREESPITIFLFDGEVPNDRRVLFDGDEVNLFLAWAKESGSRFLYLYEEVVPEDSTDPDLLAHVGETSAVEAAFLSDGIFHVFSQLAEWIPDAIEEAGIASEGAAALAAEQLRADRAQLEAAFLDEAYKDGEQLEPSEWEIDRKLRRFLAPKLSTKEFTFDSLGIVRDGSDLDQAVRDMAKAVSERLIAEEQKRVDPFVPECVAWATSLGVRSLSKSDVDAFLIEKGTHLSDLGARYLWTKAKLAVKVGRSR
jgi:hypothetical protein